MNSEMNYQYGHQFMVDSHKDVQAILKSITRLGKLDAWLMNFQPLWKTWKDGENVSQKAKQAQPDKVILVNLCLSKVKFCNSISAIWLYQNYCK